VHFVHDDVHARHDVQRLWEGRRALVVCHVCASDARDCRHRHEGHARLCFAVRVWQRAGSDSSSGGMVGGAESRLPKRCQAHTELAAPQLHRQHILPATA
jgi:hypothetical protein